MNGPIMDKTFSCPIAWALHQGEAKTSALQDEAQMVLQAHAEAAAAYIQELNEPDFHPFRSMPAGTEVRDLPSGGRSFSLSDGTFLIFQTEGDFQYLGPNGMCEEPLLEAGGLVTSDGRRFDFETQQGLVSHDAAGIQGLPVGVDLEEVSPGRFVADLPSGHRMIVSHSDGLVTLVNPNGALSMMGLSRLEGVGEKLETHLAPGGFRGFESDSGLRGSVEPSGTVHLAFSDGTDLVVHFPENSGPKQEPVSNSGPSLNDAIGGAFNV